jgi:NodT family efflux transporter outer membrane factor (OMF) lipoprotein
VRKLVALLVMAATAACNVGPTYKRPDLPSAPAGEFKENVEGSEDARAGGWRQASPSDEQLRGKWWEIFADPDLNALESRLQVDNQNIKQQFENYMAARATVRAAVAQLYPQVSLGPSVTDRGTSQGSVATFLLPLNVNWEPDLFGKIRNQITQAENAAQFSAATLANVTLSEQMNLAELYFQVRGQDALLDIYKRTIANYEESLRLTQVLTRTGIDSEQDSVQAEVTLHTAEANQSAIITTRAQFEHAIALLLGEIAGRFSMKEAPIEVAVPAVPVGVPSRLLERRPDIAAAERQVAALNAVIGINKAAYYPDVTLTGGVGTQSNDLTKLFTAGTNYWTVGGTANEKLIDFGARRAAVAQVEAQYRASVAAYRQVVLNAFKEVEDSLVATRQLAEQAERQKRAVASSERYEKLANIRYKTGVDTYLNVIIAQTNLLNGRQQYITIATNQMTNAVHLIGALGGGWSAKQLPTEDDVSDGSPSFP